MRIYALTFAIAAGLPGGAAAHPGALDSYGCHPNVAHGTYHCHLGPLAGREYASRAQMVRAYHEQQRRARPKPKRPAAAF